jgi:four helix bundle protein
VGFGFEELDVWKKSIDYANLVISLAENINTSRKHWRLIEQLESCSASVAMNIAEGKGRYSKKEFVQFLYIARGSLYESITLLIIFRDRNWIDKISYEEALSKSTGIAKMINRLIQSIKGWN